MVLTRDLNRVGCKIAHGVICSMMSERQLKSFAIKCQCHQLMTKTDAEHRHIRAKQLANRRWRNLATNTVEITSQNHNFCVDADSLAKKAEVTHINLNDNTNEGMRVLGANAFSVQYHPEAGPGPHDSRYLFGEFVSRMEAK